MGRPAGATARTALPLHRPRDQAPRHGRSLTCPGQDGSPILKRSVREFKHDDITDRAAALTYYGVLALFPAVLVLVSILGLLGKSTTQQVLSNLGQVAPGGVHTFLTNVVTQVQGKAGAACVAGIIGIVVALWSASGLCRGLHARLERHLRRRRRPPGLEGRPGPAAHHARQFVALLRAHIRSRIARGPAPTRLAPSRT